MYPAIFHTFFRWKIRQLLTIYSELSESKDYRTLATVYDSETDRTTTYYYDFTDRMMKYVESGDNYSHSVGYEYDKINNLTALVETINGVKHTTSYDYDKDNRVTSVTTDGISESYTYDAYGRVSTKVTKNGSATVLTETYTYITNSAGQPTGQVATHRTRGTGYDVTNSYTYDDNGNILTISDGTYTTTYTYDSANQLVREDNQKTGKSQTWQYDNAGNILKREEYTYTTGALGTPLQYRTRSYAYEDSEWGDLLTEYWGDEIQYDEIGNRIYDTYDYYWEHGRQLEKVVDGDYITSMTYDANGMRTGQRTYDEATNELYGEYQYIYNGSQLTQMMVDGNTLYFTYDISGTPAAVTYNGTTYYYVTNIQGDVIAILDDNGTKVVSYSYDVWGSHTSSTCGTGSMANTLGKLNPLRYRGYIYDFELGLYYLQSRYYDPYMGRFINADAYVSTGQGILGNNMFAYCGNNPVNCIDSTGTMMRYSDLIFGGGFVGFVNVQATEMGNSLVSSGTAIGPDSLEAVQKRVADDIDYTKNIIVDFVESDLFGDMLNKASDGLMYIDVLIFGLEITISAKTEAVLICATVVIRTISDIREALLD